MPVNVPTVLRERTEIREADQRDNEALLALTRETPMKGTIALRIDRDPDFFALLRLRGEAKVFVATRGDDVIGCMSAALRTTYIFGEPELTAYIGDMKVHPNFLGSRVAVRLVQAIESYLKFNNVDLSLSVVAAGNDRVLPLYEGRVGLTPCASVGKFIVKELLPSPFTRPVARYRIEWARPEDAPVIAALLDRYYRSRQFGPQIPESEVARNLNAPSEPFSRTLVACEGKRVVATLSLLDTGPQKRNVLLGAPAPARIALKSLRFVAAPLPSFCVPRIGDAVRLLTARHFACEDAHRGAFTALVSRARREAFRQRFSFLLLGLHERDPLRRTVKRMPGFTFTSLGFSGSFTPGRLEKIVQSIPFEDYALV